MTIRIGLWFGWLSQRVKCEVMNTTQLSIHGRLSPIGQQAASLKFFCPTAPSLHKVELASLEGIRTVYLEQVPLRGNCE